MTQTIKEVWCESLSCFVVGMKKNMVPGKLRIPDVISNDDREHLVIDLIVRGLRRNP